MSTLFLGVYPAECRLFHCTDRRLIKQLHPPSSRFHLSPDIPQLRTGRRPAQKDAQLAERVPRILQGCRAQQSRQHGARPDLFVSLTEPPTISPYPADHMRRLTEGRPHLRPRSREGSTGGPHVWKQGHSSAKSDHQREAVLVGRPRHRSTSPRPCRGPAIQGRHRVATSDGRGGARKATLQDKRRLQVPADTRCGTNEPYNEAKRPGIRAPREEEADRGTSPSRLHVVLLEADAALPRMCRMR